MNENDTPTLGERGDENQAKGGLNNLGGKIKEGVGKLTGNDQMEAEGKADQAKGNVQQGFGKVENKADDLLNQ